MSSSWYKNGFVYLLILVAVVTLFVNLVSPNENPNRVSLQQVAAGVKNGQVDKVSVAPDGRLTVTLRGDPPKKLISRKEQGTDFPRR